MRTLFFAALALTLFFIWLSRNDQTKARAMGPAEPSPAKVESHTWPKESLDRAQEAAALARQNHQEGEEQ